MRHVHLIGIGGTGLSAIAQVLLEKGYRVSGSDRSLSPLAAGVQAKGAQVALGHRAENVKGADLVIRSSAVSDDNPEVQAARAAGIPVLKRAQFLAELIGEKSCIAIAGTHGKTTTTAMIAWLLAAAGRDPSYIIGGTLRQLGGNAHAGAGPEFVIEADEYDYMFLGLHPQVAVVTNVEHDHPDCFPTPEDFFAAFHTFAGQVTAGGTLIACGDDAGVQRLLGELAQQDMEIRTYGLNTGDRFRAVSVEMTDDGRTCFRMAGGPEVRLQTPGLHNVRNALAALCVADWLGLPLEPAAQALGEFSGVGRRFEIRGEVGGIIVIDDYAHHPTEIRATLQAARQRFPQRELWVVWQPHTYSRLSLFWDEFLAAFAQA
ncbi:MAG TPA: UDP-N-acetylmuramate--L-alanine ligase, partial [Anaerolineales bacterium]|nr:UDP-N-acetylmuramate--L-alanine ligase [Anaerolineales bacterium]